MRRQQRHGFWGELVDLCSAVGRAMGVTLVNLIRRPITVHYPDVERVYPDRFRGVLDVQYHQALRAGCHVGVGPGQVDVVRVV